MSRPFLSLLLISTLFAGILGTFWMGEPPSNQRLLSSFASAADAARRVGEVDGFAWWTDSFRLGSSLAFLSSEALTLGGILVSGWIAGPSTGAKLIALIFWLLCPLTMYALIRRLCPDSPWSAFACGFSYLCAPPILLHLGHVEHIAVVLAFAMLPAGFWSILAFLEEKTFRRALQCAVLNALLVLAYAKTAVLALPVVVVFSAWVWMTRGRFSLPPWSAVALCIGAFFVLAVLPNLPGVRELQFVELFDFGPFVSWQTPHSSTTALSWLDRNALLTGLPTSPRSAVTTPTSYLGVLGVLCVAAVFFFRRRPAWMSQEATVFRLFVALALLAQWFGFGVHSPLLGQLAFLKISAAAPDPAIALSWAMLALQGAAIWFVMPGSLPGRSWWCAAAVAIYIFVPAFLLVEKLPLYGNLRASSDFFEIPGVFCFATAAGLAAWLLVREIPARTARAAVTTLLIGLASLDAATCVPSLWRSPLSRTLWDDFLAVQDFLRQNSTPGRVFPYSSRYFYHMTPLLSGRGLCTDGDNSHLMQRGVAELMRAAHQSIDDLRAFFNVSGASHVFVDKLDPGIPPELQTLLRGTLPVAFENAHFVLFANSTSLAPAAVAEEFVSLDTDDATRAPAALAAARRGLAAISDRTTLGDKIGQVPTDHTETRKTLKTLPPDTVHRPNAHTLHVRIGPASGWLLLPEAFHPDWTARQDGIPLEVARSFNGFLAVRLSGKPEEVVLTFSPPWWFPASLWLCLLGWVMTVGVVVGEKFSVLPSRLLSRLRAEPTSPAPTLLPPATTSLPPLVRPLLIIPTYNEAVGVTTTLNRALAAHPSMEILVIDDASPDGTAGVVRSHPDFPRRIHLLERAGKLGLGSAYRAGFAWALEHGYDTCLEMDADLSHNPDDIPRLLAALEEGADAAIGSRYRDGIRVMNWPQDRLFLSLGASKFVHLVTRLPLTDATSGFKAVRASALRGLDWSLFKAEGYGFQVELHYFLWKSGARLVEVPIVFTERQEGATKMSAGIAVEALHRVLQLGFRGR